MRPKTDDSHHRVGVPTELAHRAADGVDVLLLWVRDGELRIVVDDVLHLDRDFSLCGTLQIVDVWKLPEQITALVSPV